MVQKLERVWWYQCR